MARRYEFLDALFVGHRERLGMLAAADVYGDVLSAAETLLEHGRALGVCGLEKLIDSGGINKLRALLSELRVANLLSRLGFDVVVLADAAFGRGGVYTPDLLARRDGLEILVEVFHGSGGGPDIAGPLDRALKTSGLRFRVEYYLAEDLSVPGISYDERAAAERTAERVVLKLIEHLGSADPRRKASVVIEGNRFDYGPSPADRGYAAGGVTTAHWMRGTAHAAKLLSALERKASKQSRLPSTQRIKPFVVAYDNRESELSACTVLSALTGSRCAFTGSHEERARWKRENPVCHPGHVMTSLAGPWGDLLRGWDFGLDAEVRIKEYGALVEASWAKKLSGVLVTHIHDSVHWFPNPFADRDLCDVRLLDLGLPLHGLEPTHSAWHRYP